MTILCCCLQHQKWRAILLGILLLLGIPPTVVEAIVGAVAEESLHIAVAANFRPVIEKMKIPLLSLEKIKLKISSASTGALTQQIIHGAPFDVFLAADVERPQALEAKNLILSHSRVTYALGRLVFWAPDKQHNAKSVLAEKSVRIAFANPRLAPYGRAAMEVLDRLQLVDIPVRQKIIGRDVSQVVQFVAGGQIDGAFIALSQLHMLRKTLKLRGSTWLIPANHYQPIEQQGVILGNSRAIISSRRFMQFLTGPVAAKIMLESGYLLPSS